MSRVSQCAKKILIPQIVSTSRDELSSWRLLAKQRSYWFWFLFPISGIAIACIILNSPIFNFISICISSILFLFINLKNYKSMKVNYQLDDTDYAVLVLRKRRLKELFFEWGIRDRNSIRIVQDCLRAYVEGQDNPFQGIGILFSVFGTLAIVVLGWFTQDQKFSIEDIKSITASLLTIFIICVGVFSSLVFVLKAIYNFVFMRSVTTAKMLLEIINEILFEDAFIDLD